MINLWHQYWSAITLGLVQGLAEFVPISSSGHLILAREFLHLSDQSVFFDAVLHLSTLLAVIIYFAKDWWAMLKSLFSPKTKAQRPVRLSRNLFFMLIVGTLPALIGAVIFNNWIESHFREAVTVGVLMIISGIIFLLAERLIKSTNDLDKIRWNHALGIGLAQLWSMVPGVSRSGITIVTGMYMNLKREAAAKFSFLLSAPIIAAAGGYSLWQASHGGLVVGDYKFWLIASVVSFLSGLLAIKFLLGFLKRYPLNIFGYYMILVGLATLVLKLIVKI